MKVMYKILIFCFLITACKMTSNDEVAPSQKKVNILEHTRWRSSENNINSILDFHTSKDVKEYTLVGGQKVPGKEGTYKVKNRKVSINWGQLINDNVNGVISGNEMNLIGGKEIKSTKYYKIAEY